MQSISAFLDITKFTYFLWKNADVSRTQGVCHVIHIFFGSSLGKVKLSQASSLQDMCDRSYGGGGGSFCMIAGIKVHTRITKLNHKTLKP